MTGYLDQIPKQLAARRKAFAAARDNPALLPSCWAIVRSIANNLYDHMRNSVVGGCTFPDRPIYLSTEDAAFLNLGTTPRLLLQDRAWLEAEREGHAPPEGDDAVPGEEGRMLVGHRLAGLAGAFGRDHRVTRIYNFEPWLQEMYRDRLDVDFAEDLQRRIDDINAYMDSVPKAILATGLTGKLAKGVMDSFKLFKTITGSSHQLDREKMSFVDRRSYVDTIQKIELIMSKADESLGTAAVGRSVVRELFEMWKNANYELMALTRQLRALWGGTSLDDRIGELIGLLGAMQKTLNRCSEESRQPSPQLPVVRADDDTATGVDRSALTEAFRAVTLFDVIVGGNPVLSVREIRKFGPLAVVVAPGFGQPRYCSEIRRQGSLDDGETRRKKTKVSGEREMDFDRRVRYPLNCLVVPLCADASNLDVDIADAWLEYNQAAFPMQFKEFLEAAKSRAPSSFLPPSDKEHKDLPATYARQRLAGLTASFVRWAHRGDEPEADEAPEFDAFRDFALSRLDADAFLVPARYRPLVQLFAEAGPKRRQEMWRRCLGPRFMLDRQLIVVAALMKDWAGLRDNLKLLPVGVTKNNANLENGFARAEDASDPFAEHKAMDFFRKFLSGEPDLKAALVAVESQVSIEVETLRSQSESLGRTFQYDKASVSMMQRQESLIQEKRLQADRHIDHYLTGLMYALEGNLGAAESALAMCLVPLDQRGEEAEPPVVPGEIGAEWFEENMAPLEGKFEKREVPGENGAGTVCYDYVYYNLGLVYLRMNRHWEAWMAFRGAIDAAPPEKSHLYSLWAEAHAAAAREGVEAESRAGA